MQPNTPLSGDPSSRLTCGFCAHANPRTAKFCNECGSPLDVTPCPRCDGVNARSATECYRCGRALPAPPAAPTTIPAGGGEDRTVLKADARDSDRAESTRHAVSSESVMQRADETLAALLHDRLETSSRAHDETTARVVEVASDTALPLDVVPDDASPEALPRLVVDLSQDQTEVPPASTYRPPRPPAATWLGVFVAAIALAGVLYIASNPDVLTERLAGESVESATTSGPTAASSAQDQPGGDATAPDQRSADSGESASTPQLGAEPSRAPDGAPATGDASPPAAAPEAAASTPIDPTASRSAAEPAIERGGPADAPAGTAQAAPNRTSATAPASTSRSQSKSERNKRARASANTRSRSTAVVPPRSETANPRETPDTREPPCSEAVIALGLCGRRSPDRAQ